MAEQCLFGLLTSIRLLKSNILHLVAWNVSATSAFSPVGGYVATRFSQVLNRIIFEAPKSSSARRIAKSLVDDVSGVLSSGLTIFAAQPKERVESLSTLIDVVSKEKQGEQENKQAQILVLNRTIAEMSTPRHIIDGVFKLLLQMNHKKEE